MSADESNQAKLARGWWTEQIHQLTDGTWDVTVRIADGSAFSINLADTRDLDLSIAAAVDARLRGDRRWSKRSDRGA